MDDERTDHYARCEEENQGKHWNNYECICDDIDQEKRDSEANNGETEFEGR